MMTGLPLQAQVSEMDLSLLYRLRSIPKIESASVQSRGMALERGENTCALSRKKDQCPKLYSQEPGTSMSATYAAWTCRCSGLIPLVSITRVTHHYFLREPFCDAFLKSCSVGILHTQLDTVVSPDSDMQNALRGKEGE